MKVRIVTKEGKEIETINLNKRVGYSQMFAYCKGSKGVEKALNGQVLDVCECKEVDKDGNFDFVVSGTGPTNPTTEVKPTQSETVKPTPAVVQAKP